MQEIPKKCLACPDREDCPTLKAALAEAEAAEEGAKERYYVILIAHKSGWITAQFYCTPFGDDDNDPTSRGVFFLPSVVPPADHIRPSAGN